MSARLEQLERMLADEPHDVFLHYAVALELRKLGRAQECAKALEQLIATDNAYAPAYYQLAGVRADLGDVPGAIDAARRGRTVSSDAGDRKAAAEFGELLMALDPDAE